MIRHVARFLITLSLLVAISPVLTSGQMSTPEPTAEDTVTISGTLTVNDKPLYIWLRDDDCVVSFGGYDPEPTLLILNDQDHIVGSVSLAEIPGTGEMVPMTEQEIENLEETLGEGKVDRTEKIVSCSVPYEVTVPALENYRIVIDPVFDEPVSRGQLAATDGTFDIELEAGQADSLPTIFERPGGPIPGTDLYRIAGTFTLRGEWGEDFLNLGLGGCEGMRGYEDIKPGAQIVIKDASGTIIETAKLVDPGMGADVDIETCQFYFTADVEESEFYTIEMGRRGSMTYSFEDLEETDWHIDLVIG